MSYPDRPGDLLRQIAEEFDAGQIDGFYVGTQSGDEYRTFHGCAGDSEADYFGLVGHAYVTALRLAQHPLGEPENRSREPVVLHLISPKEEDS